MQKSAILLLQWCQKDLLRQEDLVRHSGENRNPTTPLAFGLFERRILTLKSDKRFCKAFWVTTPRLKPEGKSFTGVTLGDGFSIACCVFAVHRVGTGYHVEGKGRFWLPLPVDEFILCAMKQHRIQELPVAWRIAHCSSTLPEIHNDSFDRLLIATAQLKGLTLVSKDRMMASCPGLITLWAELGALKKVRGIVLKRATGMVIDVLLQLKQAFAR
jgi:hypothetical protein